MSGGENESFSREARQALAFARREAGRLLHPAIEPEHILLGILRADDCQAASLIRQREADPDLVRLEVERMIRTPAPPRLALDIPFSPRSEDFLAQVDSIRHSLGHDQIRTIHLLLAMTGDTSLPVCAILARHGVTIRAVLERLLIEQGIVRDSSPLELLIIRNLVKTGRLTDGIARALLQRNAHENVKDILLAEGHLTEMDVARILARESGAQSVDLAEFDPDASLLRQFPADLARRLEVLPLRYDKDEDALFIAVANPLERDHIEEIQNLWGVKVVTMVAPEFTLKRLIAEHYPASSA